MAKTTTMTSAATPTLLRQKRRQTRPPGVAGAISIGSGAVVIIRV
jgi:hypothetical protein